MICFGIDISKRKSTGAILNVQGEIVRKPFEFKHTQTELNRIVTYLNQYPKEEVKIVMEATGIYHQGVLDYFVKQGFFVHVANPLVIKKFFDSEIRKGKTDKKDALKLSAYGTMKWFKLENYTQTDSIYSELMMLSREYNQLVSIRTKVKIQLHNLIERIFPGLEKILYTHYSELLFDFLKIYPHSSVVLRSSELNFTKKFIKMAEKKGHYKGPKLAKKIYELASECVPSIPHSLSVGIAVENCIQVLRTTQNSTNTIITRMSELAKALPEYNVVREMTGIGETLAPRLIAEIGDVRRFKSAKSLIAYAGIDAPPYQSGQFEGTRRYISKRGSRSLRKCGYEIMFMVRLREPLKDKAVYDYIQKKRAEGKHLNLVMMAALNKFLRIYYARVMEVYRENI